MRAALLLAGSALFGLSWLLHPLLLDRDAERLAYHTIATYGLWPAVHVGALAGLAIWTAAMVLDAAEPARLCWTVGLAVWAVVLIFEAVAMPRLALRPRLDAVPGLWAWSLAAGYVATAFEGLGLAAYGLSITWGTPAYRRLTVTTGVLVAVVSPLAYALPAAALPLLLLAGAAWGVFVVWTAWIWWPQRQRGACRPVPPAGRMSRRTLTEPRRKSPV